MEEKDGILVIKDVMLDGKVYTKAETLFLEYWNNYGCNVKAIDTSCYMYEGHIRPTYYITLYTAEEKNIY